ncbi:MAG: ferrous iron transport protein B [Elusimicrobia bacterium]|nr:ferrous iron transport protein B [Elusimicrobiota bacterium]
MKERKEMVVALAGNPNSGKTSLFNAIAGTHLKVGNWPGVTVEKYEGYVDYKDYRLRLVDLPGTYSINAYSPEETIARDFIAEKKADIVVNVVDGTSLERNLYLTTQLLELDPKMVVALNMYDEVEKLKIGIDFKMLQKLLGSHVVPVSAVKKTGIEALLDHVVRTYENKIVIPRDKISYSEEIEEALAELQGLLETDIPLSAKFSPRWLAVKLLENDQFAYSLAKESPVWVRLEHKLPGILNTLEGRLKERVAQRISEDRHAFARGAYKETVKTALEEKKTITDHIDSVVLNRFLGVPLFLFIMWLIFQITFTFGEVPMGWLESFFAFLGDKVSALLPEGVLRSLVVDGMIAGVGGVVGFLPNILLLFLGLSFLESTGYMARAAFVVDRAFHKIGLHGKSFIPMVTGFGCSVPAFMACRTLKNRGDRLATMMVIPFMSCGAKLPVHILLIGAFFPTSMSANILFGVYLFGIVVAVLSAKLFKSTIFKGRSEPFVMELPVYRLPTLRSVLMQMWIKAWMYLKKAGTVILAVSIVVWLVCNFPVNDKLNLEYGARIEAVKQDKKTTAEAKAEAAAALENELAAKQMEHSFAGRTGKLIEPFIRPLGFDWRLGVALTAGLAAKEVVVATMGTIYALGAAGESESLTARLRSDPAYNPAIALALIVFVLLYVPCLSATAVFHQESGELKMTLFYIFYTMTAAWVLSFAVYKAGSAFL